MNVGSFLNYTHPLTFSPTPGRDRRRAAPLTHACGVGPPEDGDPLPLAGSAVGDEGLAVAVLVDRALTHVRHA